MLPELSHSDWLVLGVLGTGATHGFAVSTSLSKDGDLGRIWAVRRPMVYQSVAKLVALGLVAERATERSASGPSRTPLQLTRKGRRVLADWLVTPVEHLRDMRPLLLAKLAFLARQGADARPLLEAQHEQLAALLEAPQTGAADDVQRVVDAWRRQAARAVLAFLEEQRAPR
ncbi:MAG: PadR family transcriptional regulator [Marmoricola sp.]